MQSNELWREIEHCRICGEAEFLDVLDLGHHALSGRFPAAGEADAPRAPLALILCTGCGLVQLRHDVERDSLYRHDYGYRSGINEMMRSHLSGLAARIGDTVALGAGDVILDIGSNDATLLKSYPAGEAALKIGIDPTADQFRDSYPTHFRAVADYFDEAVYMAASDGRAAKAITSIAMFYDLPDPNRFVADIARVLDSQGIWVLELSYLPRMLETNAFDTICHEHLEYYALAQIEELLGRHGLRAFDVTFNEVNGGSFCVFACHREASYFARSGVTETRAREAAMGLATLAPYEAFAERISAIRDRLNRFLAAQTAGGKTVFGYGASTKGNTVLQFCGITREQIPAAVDRNPAKWGRRLPATAIPIISESEARRHPPDYFLAFPWHFRDSFLVRERAFRDAGGRFVFAIPEFEIV